MIKRLYIHNFKCLENFTLPIGDCPSALLIGKNGSGKSSVGLALKILQSIGRGTNRIGQLAKPSDFTRGRTAVPMRFEIEVALHDKLYGYTLALELPEGFEELRIFEEKLTVAGEPIYHRNNAQIRLSNQNSEAQFLVDWHLAALPIIQTRSQEDPIHIFKTWLAQMLILAPVPSLINGDSQASALWPNQNVANFGEWFTGLLAQFPAVYTQIDKYIKGIIPDFHDIQNSLVGRNARTLNVQFRQEKAALTIPFQELSDGEKCFFISALVLAASQSINPLFCFWDEPDNYLAISEVGYFITELRRSFQDGSQIIITSHNEEAMRRFSDENTFLLYRRNHLEPTQVNPISELRRDGKVIGDLATAVRRDDVQL